MDVGVEVPVDEALVRGLQDARMDAGGTVVGGYGQFQGEWRKVGPDDPYEGTARVRRLVVFVAHDFSAMGAPIRAYTELEWEDAIACDGCEGSVEVEQAFLEWRLAGDLALLRAGLVLVPMGIVNQWHEPPVFHGVDRPRFDQLVIPSTWRELGVGMVGRAGVARWELYAHTPLDPAGLGPEGLINGRTLGSVSPADAIAVSGRFEAEPLLGFVVGASGYASDAGGALDAWSPTGERLDLSIPVLGAEVDARWRRGGLEARVIGAAWALPEADDLMEALREDGSPYFPEGTGAVASRTQGGYVEVAYDVFHPFDVGDHQLLPFARLEAYDTNAAVPDGWDRDPALNIQEGTFGLSYRPIPTVVFKADLQLRDREYGLDEQQWNAGFGYMF